MYRTIREVKLSMRQHSLDPHEIALSPDSELHPGCKTLTYLDVKAIEEDVMFAYVTAKTLNFVPVLFDILDQLTWIPLVIAFEAEVITRKERHTVLDDLAAHLCERAITSLKVYKDPGHGDVADALVYLSSTANVDDVSHDLSVILMKHRLVTCHYQNDPEDLRYTTMSRHGFSAIHRAQKEKGV